ncbi:hypothetical protein NY607_19375 [Lysinibacillus sp. A4]|uniref:hypothetical protein n=1 Tax=Lysinibacillus sp. A4 TaxID=2976269 RepID=UPI002175962F|nr:hypothetical protein [Lysinibacillus sp. A4]MCS5503271.1 hypothetical protein [Lysinibacillus sp. A4]
MQKELLQETQHSYYDYVVKIEGGCQQIANCLRTGKESDAFEMLMDLSEGIEWLVTVEHKMREYFYGIKSRLPEVLGMLKEVKQALEIGDIVTVADLFEYEIAPMFVSASEWTFEKLKN